MYMVWWFFFQYIRPVIKWFLRKTTGLCELQRICYGKQKGTPRTLSVEYSLNMSRSVLIKSLIVHLNDISDHHRFVGENRREMVQGAVDTILLVKKINPRIHFQFVSNLTECVGQIWDYRQLNGEIEAIRTTAYDCDNLDHEQKLYKLWSQLMPDEELISRITKQWQEVGFQGDDPKTDFRGMGLLGLENLLAFSTDYNEAALHVLSHSRHPIYGYAFAIVGINLTSLAWNLWREGEAKTFLYNVPLKNVLNVKLFHDFYSYLFYEFDKYWIECKPNNMMEFSHIRDNFEVNIRRALKDHSTTFRLNLTVDVV